MPASLALRTPMYTVALYCLGCAILLNLSKIESVQNSTPNVKPIFEFLMHTPEWGRGWGWVREWHCVQSTLYHSLLYIIIYYTCMQNYKFKFNCTAFQNHLYIKCVHREKKIECIVRKYGVHLIQVERNKTKLHSIGCIELRRILNIYWLIHTRKTL